MGTTIAEKKTLYKRLSQIQKFKPTGVPTINKVVSLIIGSLKNMKVIRNSNEKSFRLMRPHSTLVARLTNKNVIFGVEKPLFSIFQMPIGIIRNTSRLPTGDQVSHRRTQSLWKFDIRRNFSKDFKRIVERNFKTFLKNFPKSKVFNLGVDF